MLSNALSAQTILEPHDYSQTCYTLLIIGVTHAQLLLSPFPPISLSRPSHLAEIPTFETGE